MAFRAKTAAVNNKTGLALEKNQGCFLRLSEQSAPIVHLKVVHICFQDKTSVILRSLPLFVSPHHQILPLYSHLTAKPKQKLHLSDSL